MRNNIINKIALSLSLLGMFASCSNEDANPMETECFISFAGPEIKLSSEDTRAIVKGTAFPDNSSFGVLGYCLANQAGSTNLDINTGSSTWGVKKTLSTPHLFYNLQVTKSGNACSYNAVENTTTKQDVTNGLVAWYTNADFRYTFLAYYPYSVWTVPSISNVGEPTISYNLSDISNAPDLMVASNIDMFRGSGSIKFNFKHLMTGLKVQINNYDDEQSLRVTALSITGNFNKTVALSTNLTPTVSGTFSDLHSFEASTIAANSYKEYDPLLFLPKDNGNGTSNIGNNIKLNITYVSLQNGSTKTAEVSLANDFASFNPQSGVIYNLQLSFKGNALVVEIVQANNGNWEGGASVDSDVTFE